MDYMCDPGHFCPRQTKGFLRNRNKCLVGQYCPEGTADGFSTETQCPYGTTSRSGSTVLTDCEVLPTDICDKSADYRYLPSYTYSFKGEQVTYEGLKEVQVLKIINPVNESSSMAYWKNDTVEITGVCPPALPASALVRPPVVENATEPAADAIYVDLYGLHFIVDTLLFCEVRVNVIDPLVDARSYSAIPTVLRAEIVSETHVRCPVPLLEQ
jgi:hypothetical protein